MKAFNKIYIPFVDLGEDGLCQAPIWWDKNKQDEKPECKGTIEYLRKDALLEWAKECYKAIKNDNQLSPIFKQGALYELHRVIVKIESL